MTNCPNPATSLDRWPLQTEVSCVKGVSCFSELRAQIPSSYSQQRHYSYQAPPLTPTLRFYLQFSTQISWNQLRYKRKVFSLDNRGTADDALPTKSFIVTIHPCNYGQIHKYKSPFRLKVKRNVFPDFSAYCYCED